MMTYLPSSVWIIVRHVEAVHKTKEIKTVIFEWPSKVPQPWHICRDRPNYCGVTDTYAPRDLRRRACCTQSLLGT